MTLKAAITWNVPYHFPAQRPLLPPLLVHRRERKKRLHAGRLARAVKTLTEGDQDQISLGGARLGPYAHSMAGRFPLSPEDEALVDRVMQVGSCSMSVGMYDR